MGHRPLVCTQFCLMLLLSSSCSFVYVKLLSAFLSPVVAVFPTVALLFLAGSAQARDQMFLITVYYHIIG